jgi:hypothetical protein
VARKLVSASGIFESFVRAREAERKSCTKILLCVSRAKTPRPVLDL